MSVLDVREKMKEQRFERRLEIYDEFERALIEGITNFGEIPIPAIGDTFQADHEEFLHIGQSPTYRVIRRHFVIHRASITVRIYGRDIDVGKEKT